jgi:gliding motility-associated-like protein
MEIKFLLFSYIICIQFAFFAQSSWDQSEFDLQYFEMDVGQFGYYEQKLGIDNIMFCFDSGHTKFFFTQNGYYVYFESCNIRERSDEEVSARRKHVDSLNNFHVLNRIELFKEYRLLEKKCRLSCDEFLLSVEWINSSDSMSIEFPIELSSIRKYHHISLDNNGKQKIFSSIPISNKIIYKNLYPDIDLVFELSHDKRIKYSLICHPGFNIHNFKLNFSKKMEIGDSGELHYDNSFVSYSESAPISYYQNDRLRTIPTRTVADDSGFIYYEFLEELDFSSKIVIDPWINVFSDENLNRAVHECRTDNQNNTYVVLGTQIFEGHRLVKINENGDIAWIMNLPQGYYPTIDVDEFGNVYLANVSGLVDYYLSKIDPDGQEMWTIEPEGFLEIWGAKLNCDQNSLHLYGTGLFESNELLGPRFSTYITESGEFVESSYLSAQTDSLYLAQAVFKHEEIKTLSVAHLDYVVCATQTSMFSFHSNQNDCFTDLDTMVINHDRSMAYGMTNFRGMYSGAPLIESYNNQFIFFHRGDSLEKIDFNNGESLSTIALLNGAVGYYQDLYYYSYAGLIIDNCGYIYVGVNDQILKFDTSLVLVETYQLGFVVHDIAFLNNGFIVACGRFSSDTQIDGFVSTFNVSHCGKQKLECCDFCNLSAQFEIVSPICDFTNNGSIDVLVSGGSGSYEISLNEMITNNSSFDFLSAGNYNVLIRDSVFSNCAKSYSLELLPISPCLLSFPNVFSPNNDGINDSFFVFNTIGVESFRIVFLNRWGNEIRSFDSIVFEWDGTDINGSEISEGVYFYYFEGEYMNEENFSGHGFVHLIRE